jgi:hypothetical protein
VQTRAPANNLELGAFRGFSFSQLSIKCNREADLPTVSQAHDNFFAIDPGFNG